MRNDFALYGKFKLQIKIFFRGISNVHSTPYVNNTFKWWLWLFSKFASHHWATHSKWMPRFWNCFVNPHFSDAYQDHTHTCHVCLVTFITTLCHMQNMVSLTITKSTRTLLGKKKRENDNRGVYILCVSTNKGAQQTFYGCVFPMQQYSYNALATTP